MAEGGEEDVLLDKEDKELLDTLSKKRKAFRESFKLVPRDEKKEEPVNGEQATTSFVTDELLDTMRARRVRRKMRKGDLPPIELASTGGRTREPVPIPSADSSLQIFTATANVANDIPLGGSNIRHLRERQQDRRTRFDDLVLSPTHQRPTAVSPPPVGASIRHASDRWKILSSKIGEVKEKVEEQSAMEFFLGGSPTHTTQPPPQQEQTDTGEELTAAPPQVERGLEEEEPVPAVHEDEGEGDGGGEPTAVEDGDQSTLLARQEDLLALEANVKVFQEYGFPRYIPYQERLLKEKEILCLPDRLLAPSESKTPDHAPPVLEESAGLYIGQRPKVSIGNLATMENRLLRRPDEGKGWFGRDGLILTTPEPEHGLITRPLIIAEDPSHHLVYREQPSLAGTTVDNIAKKSNDDVKNWQMEIFLGEIRFTHHPLFSSEHVLSSLLMRQCEQYHRIDRGRLIEQYRQQIVALKHSIQDLRQSGAADGVTSEQLKHYSLEVRAKRQQLKQAGTNEYQLVQKILENWRELKQLREQQGYACTSTQLIVHKVATDVESEQRLWERDIEAELVEKREDYESGFATEMAQYAEELAEWKSYEKARRKLIRRKGSSQSQASVVPPPTPAAAAAETSEEAGSQLLETDPALVIPPKRPRPTGPPPFDEVNTRRELVEYYHQYHRKPGDPKLVPKLTQNYPITQRVPKDEQRRRNAVGNTKYKIRVLYNNKELFVTTDKYMSSDFSLSFNELVTAKIVEIPYSIELQLINTSSRLPLTTIQLYIPIPDSSIISSTAQRESYQFSSNQQITYDHTAVGCGHTHPLLPNHGELVTGGHVTLTACWAEGKEGQPLCPSDMMKRESSSQLERIARVGVTGVSNVQKLKKWIEEAHLDPNDPRNWELLDLIESIPSTQEETKYFRMDKIDDDARFVDEDELNNNRRFTLLKLRDQGHPALKGQSIPMNEEGVTDSLWKSVHDYRPYSLAELPVSIFGNFYDGRREERLKYLNDVREKVLKRAGSHPVTELTLEDIIHEEVIPNIGTLGVTVFKVFEPRRPLKPQRVTRRRPKPQNAHVDSCHVTVRVVRAVNVPIREGENGDRDKNLVQSFVAVRFGKESSKTRSAYGPHPHWNEELVLPFHPPDNDFTPITLQKITDELEFHLYDEVTVDLTADERHRHQMFEKKWLGSLTIPFSTLHAQTRIEGTFQLNTPLVLLGYCAPPTSSTLSDESTHTYIQLFISLEPALSMLPPINDKFDSLEDSLLLERGRVWLKTLREKYPDRNYAATALDVNGKNVFVTRFIRPQNPPPSLLPENYQTLTGRDLLRCMERLAWFVSLIPFLPDAILFSGTCDIWSTSELFLQMLGGDEEEHAVLLCNYFLFLGQRAWLVLGSAIPEGPTAYVLTPHPVSSTSYIFWNPSSGKRFHHTLSHIPLTSIGSLINNENIWGNVQEWDHPGRVTFDLQSAKNWSPLFSSTAEPLESIQVDMLEYSETDPIQVQQLQTRIDQLVHSHIEQLRVPHLTRWNRLCCRVLQRISPRLEENPFSSIDISREHKRQLQESLPGYKITGYPLHIRYSDTTQLLRAVESTGLHLCQYQMVEFAMNVHIHSYPNDILSVWLYLATVVPPTH